jgi:hypothetical protein
MCAMAEVFALHPWDIDRLTVEQFDMFEAYLERREKEARRG